METNTLREGNATAREVDQTKHAKCPFKQIPNRKNQPEPEKQKRTPSKTLIDLARCKPKPTKGSHKFSNPPC